MVIKLSLFLMIAPTTRKGLIVRVAISPGVKKVAEICWLGNLVMDLKVKSLRSPDGKNHLIIITAGLIDAGGLEQIFRQVAETIQRQFNCRILIDFEKANLRLEPTVIDEVVNELGPDLRLGNIKFALVSPAKIDESEQMRILRDALASQDLTTAVFDNTKEAVTWLVNTA